MPPRYWRLLSDTRTYQGGTLVSDADPTLAAIEGLAQRQRADFLSGRSRDVGFRIARLRQLRAAVASSEERIQAALKADLGKPELEGYGSEVSPLLNELDALIAHTARWARPRRVPTPLLVPGRSVVYPEPYGAVLVMAPWNYPLQLALIPAAGAIAAGNHVTIKPSEYAPATAQVIADLVASCFDPEHVTVVMGGPGHGAALTAQQWDYIFFTGGTAVGTLVMKAAAEYLTPVTLELGGKNPCVVTQHADLVAAAKRIAWGKFFNAGQTCIAPDYLLVHRSVKERLIEELRLSLGRFYGDDPAASPDYGRIVGERQLGCLVSMLSGERVVIGGQSDASQRYLAPTVVDDVTWESPLMAEEIFGPILPILTYDDLETTMRDLVRRPKPLAAYLFSRDPAEKRLMEGFSAGGVVINDVIMHFNNPNLPFGGVGQSGMGAYHGKRTFTTFTHDKAVVIRRGWPRLLGVRWPPYRLPMWLIRLSLRWFG